MIEIPNLTIDRDGDGPDVQVMLTQDFGGNAHMVTLHPCQVKLLAERIGLLAPDAEAQRTIARLRRHLLVLADRVDRLDTMFLRIGEKGHEDVDAEIAFSAASLELADEFIRDLPEENDPKTGGIAAGNPPKTGGTSAPSTAADRQRRYRERQRQRDASRDVT